MNDDSDSITERFDSICYALVRELKLETYLEELPLDMQPTVIVLHGLISLIRSAIDHGRDKDAVAFFTQTFKSIKRDQQHRRPSKEADEIARVLRFAVILVAGWCVHILRTVEQPQTKSEHAALGVFEECVNHTRDFEDLAKLWEEEREKQQIATEHRNSLIARFGVEDWDRSYVKSMRPGFPTGHSLETGWVFDGVLALMLRRLGTRARPSSAANTRAATSEAAQWPLDAWNPEHVRIRAEKFEPKKWLFTEATEPSVQVGNLLKRLDERSKTVRLRQLEIVISTPIAKHKYDELVIEVRRNVAAQEESDFYGILEKLGVADITPERELTPSAQVQWALDKQDFLPNIPEAHGLPEMIAADLARRATFQTFGSAENAATPEKASLAQIYNLKTRISEAVEALRKLGFAPNLIVIPQEYRWRESLLGEEHWKAPTLQKLGHFHVGSIEEMEVIVWPYSNPKSILIGDTPRLFTRAHTASDNDRLSSNPPVIDETAHKNLLHRAGSFQKSAEIPDTRSVKVLVDFKLTPKIHLLDSAAARRIDIAAELLSEETTNE